jgi:hypothetical protein
MRFVAPYNEALARHRGRRPGIATRLANRIWVGQPELLKPELSSDSRRHLTSASRRKVTES